jgi:hypothetical protein
MRYASVVRNDISKCFCLYALAAFVLSARPVAGQVNAGTLSIDAGTPSWSAFDTDPTGTTAINLQNLNISLNIPVMSKNGAVPFRFALHGNSNYYKGSSSTWATGLSAGLQNAANTVLGFGELQGVFYGSASPATCSNENNIPTTVLSNFYIMFADGTSHPLPPTEHVDSAGCLPPSSFTATTIDGSGYTVSIANCCNVTSFYDKNGNSIAWSPTTGAPSFADPNGNSMSVNFSTGAFTDTLGLAALTASSTGFASGTYAWAGPGTSPQVSVSSTSYTALRSAFGCSGITEVNENPWSLSTGISFPDTSSMSLTYEATPGYSSDTTGRLTKVTLRSGGTVSFGYPGTSSNNYGMNCTYQLPTSMTRTTSDGQWSYTLGFFAIGSIEAGETDTVLDPGKNKKVYTFTRIGPAGVEEGYLPALTEVQYYTNIGSVSSPLYPSTPTKQVIYCYGRAPVQAPQQSPAARPRLFRCRWLKSRRLQPSVA